MRVPELVGCESVAAITTHVRIVGSRPIKLGGHTFPRPRALCDREIAWDTRSPIAAVRCRDCKAALEELTPAALARWSGPLESDLARDGLSLRWSVPSERWPFGPPAVHERGCNLLPQPDRLRPGGLYCDCAASATEDHVRGMVAP